MAGCAVTKEGVARKRGPEQVAAILLDHIRAHRFTEAASLFFVPEGYEVAMSEREQRDIARALQVLEEEFGALEVYAPHPGPPRTKHVAIFAGAVSDLATPKTLPAVVRVGYQARFTREGNAYVRIDLTPLNQEWTVRGLRYELDAEQPGTDARIDAAVRRLIDEIRPP